MGKVKVIITGDTHLGGGRVNELAKADNADKLFGPFLEKIRDADISVTNLESPVIDSGFPILKTGPNLKSPIESLPVLKSAGFDLLTLANNHIMDYGTDGLISTLEQCEKLSFSTVGAGLNRDEAEKPFIKEVNGFRIGFLNIAENEFGTTSGYSPGGQALNPVRNYYTIRNASGEVDYLIVIVHGGHENYPLPSPAMKERYRFFADSGADLVVGHHPHCYSGYEKYGNSQIYFSLGNFMFDSVKNDTSAWNKGFMLELILEEDVVRLNKVPYIQNGEIPGLRKLTGNELKQFESDFSELSGIISDDRMLEEKFNRFCVLSRNQYSSYIEPHSVKFLHSLRNRNLFPSLLSLRKKRLLLNLTRCEAHRDVLIRILQS